MFPEQPPEKTKCRTLRQRSHKTATPGDKEETCLVPKRDVQEKENTCGETLRCHSFKLHLIQHNCSAHSLHHRKPSTIEKSMSPLASRRAMSFKPAEQGIAMPSVQRWMPSKLQVATCLRNGRDTPLTIPPGFHIQREAVPTLQTCCWFQAAACRTCTTGWLLPLPPACPVEGRVGEGEVTCELKHGVKPFWLVCVLTGGVQHSER